MKLSVVLRKNKFLMHLEKGDSSIDITGSVSSNQTEERDRTTATASSTTNPMLSKLVSNETEEGNKLPLLSSSHGHSSSVGYIFDFDFIKFSYTNTSFIFIFYLESSEVASSVGNISILTGVLESFSLEHPTNNVFLTTFLLLNTMIGSGILNQVGLNMHCPIFYLKTTEQNYCISAIRFLSKWDCGRILRIFLCINWHMARIALPYRCWSPCKYFGILGSSKKGLSRARRKIS